MFIYQSIILGIVQGLSEFLPVSSSGHLLMLPIILNWQSPPLVFDVVLHIGTALALIIYFFNDLKSILVSFLKDLVSNNLKISKYSKDSKLGIYILIGSIPAGVIGFFTQDIIENTFHTGISIDLLYVSVFLLLGSILMYVSEKYFASKHTKNNSDTLTYSKSFLVGLFQALALLPGVSRSGSTISGGMVFGLSREKAARFSFLLSVPIVVIAGVFKMYSSYTQLVSLGAMVVLGGVLSSFVVGVICIKFLLSYLKTHSIYLFIFYRLVISLLLIFVYFVIY